MENILLPQDLSSALRSETKDFVLEAGRAQPLKKSFSLILIGAIWTGIASLFLFALFGPLFQGKEIHLKLNGVPTVASPDNLGPIIGPAIMMGIFVLIGIGMLSGGIYMIFKKGGYFVGTPTRLVHFQSGKMRSIDWEQFSGDIEVSGNVSKGNISLKMRTGRMIRRRKGPDRYVPDVIYISEIPNVFDVEQICRKRIKENDPTPATTENNIA